MSEEITPCEEVSPWGMRCRVIRAHEVHRDRDGNVWNPARADALVRDILESVCRRDGLSLESAVVPGEPARNYDLALRLGIGHVFGLKDPKPQPAPALAAAPELREAMAESRRYREALEQVAKHRDSEMTPAHARTFVRIATRALEGK